MSTEKGNIYLAQVHSVAVSYRAAFVDYGAVRDGFLPFDEIENKYKTKRNHETGERIIRRDAVVVVQVKKPAVTGKGALLTTHLSLAGDYVAYLPDRLPRGMVSRKIEEGQERERLQQIASDLAKTYRASLVVRTEAAGQSAARIEKDLKKLITLHENIQAQAQKRTAPALLYQEGAFPSVHVMKWLKALFLKK